MRIQYLGTGASEGIPGIFCHCNVCSCAREKGGRDVRRRSSVLIDGRILVDITPDVWSQMLLHSVDTAQVDSILVTHVGAEHYYPGELQNLAKPFRLTEKPEHINIYGSQGAAGLFENGISPRRRGVMDGIVTFNTLSPFKTIKIDDYQVTPLEARNSEEAMVFFIESGDSAFICANDSGYWPESTWDFLDGKKIGGISLDCNNPFNSDTVNHMCLEDVVTTRHRLFQMGCMGAAGKVIITHISHNCGLGHAALQERMTLYGVTLAYDGLSITV